MARDIVYYFDKVKGSGIGLGGVQGHELGEIQTDFNMSFTIDGTKDSCKIKVLSYTNYELEPFTIIFHPATQTWWIVKNDKVEREINESGYLYIHNINLNGAIDLLGARDLTDCACNSKIYTIHQVASKLIALSNFEFPTTFNYQNNVNSNDTVDYVKTFENYSLLSALREFFDGYNCSLKMTFNTHYATGNYYLDSANILVYSKSGNVNNAIIDIDTFDDVRETRTIGSNSFGTTVCSNAENVISTKAQTYPSAGVVKLSSKEYQVQATGNTNNAILRLPTKAYQVNWLRLWVSSITCEIQHGSDYFEITLYPLNKPYSLELFTQKMEDLLVQYPNEEQDIYEIIARFDTIFENMLHYSTVTLFNGIIYNPNDTFTIPSSVPYMVDFTYNNNSTTRKFGLFPKEVRDAMERPWQGVAWERGSDELTGFDFLSLSSGITWDYLQYNDGGDSTGKIYELNSFTIWSYRTSGLYDTSHKHHLALSNYSNDAGFQVNYIPMSDLKIKVENQTDKRDIHLYNQNGKFVDSVALSKLLNSYADEISSDNITRFMTYYSFSSVPKVGTIVDNNGTKYVINNVSVDFTQNEQNGSVAYFIQAEVTLSKQIAVKSININANSNIRDYGIPQNNNVARKQLYRDYYEFALNYDTSSDTDWYVSLQDELLLINTTKNNKQALIKITWYNDNNYYYQLPIEVFPLKKQIVEIVDFKDNNIIGYTSQNVNTGFNISRLFQNDFVNVPISYVNDWGSFKGIELLMSDNTQIETAYDQYLQSEGEDRQYANVLANYPFIPQYIYDYANNNGLVKYKITENDYQKDPLEVPVFEHITQLNNSDEVIVGANIFDDHSEETNVSYIYAWGYAPKNKANEYNASSFVTQTITRTGTAPFYVWSIHHPCRLGYGTKNDHKVIGIELFEDWSSNNGFQNGMAVNNSYDLVVFRIAYNPYTNEVVAKDLMFVVNVGENAEYTPSQGIYLYINHYKVEK